MRTFILGIRVDYSRSPSFRKDLEESTGLLLEAEREERKDRRHYRPSDTRQSDRKAFTRKQTGKTTFTLTASIPYSKMGRKSLVSTGDLSHGSYFLAVLLAWS
uniref:hypothetical protein n=1 Tax=Jatropha curcas TaxID=180498 RepID=UPI00279FEAB3|nr:hypothetical protein QLP06_mgp111 [Jatropha curcas]WFG81128.1 hypothetical protein [Jatropha curcas]